MKLSCQLELQPFTKLQFHILTSPPTIKTTQPSKHHLAPKLSFIETIYNQQIWPKLQKPKKEPTKMAKLLLSPLLLLLIFYLHCTTTLAQSPVQSPLAPSPVQSPLAQSPLAQSPVQPPLAQSPVQSPPPPGPTNITGILSKAGRFTTLIRLLQITQTGDQINTQLNKSNQGLTIFAPTDAAFSSLKPGILNQLTNLQKISLIQFHVLPTFFSISQFQTASNPLRTQAGDTQIGQFPLNVTAYGNQVNLTSGVVNATVTKTIYTDGQLAVYQVDQVLVPLSFVTPPAPAPAPSKPEKAASSDAGPSRSSTDTSAAMDLIQRLKTLLSSGAVVTVAFSIWLL